MTSPHDAYLAALPSRQRAALEKLRRQIRAAAPDAEECLSYGLAAFRHHGALVAYGATPNHCAFYPMDGTTVAAHKAELRRFETGKGTIRFQPEKPLPAALVRRIVKSRVAANEGRAGRPAKRTDAAVDALLAKLKPPLKREIDAVRRVILGASPSIGEGVKWNAPSFKAKDCYFATFLLRSTDAVQLVFHRGAKSKDNTTAAPKIAYPAERVKWLAKDRCLVTVGKADRRALAGFVRAWITCC
jgi:uncharacterized protein YdhG (YjbR/CyaY superfamily)